MIQKNRIMTKKGIIIFDRNIDVEKTQENGKKVCEAYAPLIQQRIRLKMRLPLHTGSLIQVSSDIKSGNGIESEYINRIMKEGDQVDCFLNYIDEMIDLDFDIIFSSFNIDLPFLILRNIYLLCPFVKFNRDINIPIICYMGTFRLLHGDILSVAWGH